MRLSSHVLACVLIFGAISGAGNAHAQTNTELKPLPRFEHPDLQHASGLIEKGQYFDAVAELQAIKEQNPQQKGVARELGIAYYKLGDYPHASSALRDAISENDGDKEAVQLLGLSYYFSGRAQEAIPLLEKVQSWFPRANVDAAYILGICYIQSKDYDNARKSFASMYGVGPDSAASHLFLARMLLRQGFDPIAEQEAKKALTIDAHLPLAHYLLGELYIFKSRIPEATKELEAELAINPANASTYYRLADAYTRVGRWDEAEKLLQRSLWLDSTASGPYILMGKVLLNKNEPILAERSLQRALSMDPNNYVTHHLLGETYRAMGRSADADSELKLSERLQAKQNRPGAEARP